jgi:uncharacterized protein (DUF488 family)
MEQAKGYPAVLHLGLIHLFTIGYQGRTLDEFVSLLAANDIDILVDVRHTPWSRKPDFRKARLATGLESNSIDYVHLPEFGSAPGLRERLKQTGDWASFANAYSQNLSTMDEHIRAVLGVFKGKRICLLCLEADPEVCHRSILAEQIVDKGFSSSLVHL